ncbi:MAG: haloacid dehalogenase [Tepidiforma sp.]|nr:MAG: haloacid dehalogenase [Tepidiforma sp.]
MTLSGFAAVIFDMDGVLVDGEPLHFRAVNELLAEEGLSISLEAYKPYMGTKTGWRDMARDLGLKRPLDEYADRYRGIILAKYCTEAEPMPGAVELVRELQRARVPLALASSSIEPWVQACLDRLGLSDAFNAIVTGSDVQQGKPDPEIYRLAAARLGIEPSRCLAFEDAPAGILAARAAGMTVWAVRTPYTRGLALPDPHREFDSLEQVSLDVLLGAAA